VRLPYWQYRRDGSQLCDRPVGGVLGSMLSLATLLFSGEIQKVELQVDFPSEFLSRALC